MTENRMLDLGALTLYDLNAIPPASNPEELEATLTQHLVANVQFIFAKLLEAKKESLAALHSLPEEQQVHDFEQAPLFLKLPESATVFPRSRRLPEEQQLTKWEKFAKEKGIRKRKKEGMGYDSSTKTMVARWGKKSKKNLEVPIMEEKEAGRNPFDDEKNSKKLRREKQSLREHKNKEAHARIRSSRGKWVFKCFIINAK